MAVKVAAAVRPFRGMPVMWSLLAATILAGFAVGVAMKLPQAILQPITGPASWAKAVGGDSLPQPILKLPWNVSLPTPESTTQSAQPAGSALATGSGQPLVPSVDVPAAAAPPLAVAGVETPARPASGQAGGSTAAGAGSASLQPTPVAEAVGPSSGSSGASSPPVPAAPPPAPMPTPQAAGPPGPQSPPGQSQGSKQGDPVSDQGNGKDNSNHNGNGNGNGKDNSKDNNRKDKAPKKR